MMSISSQFASSGTIRDRMEALQGEAVERTGHSQSPMRLSTRSGGREGTDCKRVSDIPVALPARCWSEARRCKACFVRQSFGSLRLSGVSLLLFVALWARIINGIPDVPWKSLFATYFPNVATFDNDLSKASIKIGGGIGVQFSDFYQPEAGPIHIEFTPDVLNSVSRQILVANETNEIRKIDMVLQHLSVIPTEMSGSLNSPAFLQGDGVAMKSGSGSGGSDGHGRSQERESEEAIMKEVKSFLKRMTDSPVELIVSLKRDGSLSLHNTTFLHKIQSESSSKVVDEKPSMLESSEEATQSPPMSLLESQTAVSVVNEAFQDFAEIFGRHDVKMELLPELDRIIITFPADLSDESEKKVLSGLKVLVAKLGDGIAGWTISQPVFLKAYLPKSEAAASDNESNTGDASTILSERESNSELKTQTGTFSSENNDGTGREETCELCALGEKSLAELSAKSAGYTASDVNKYLPQDPFLRERQWGMYSINAPQAWVRGEKGNPAVKVAIIDTGVHKHPDLDSRIWRNPNERVDGKDNDANGMIDDVEGYDFRNKSAVRQDENGHGTHVAGIVGASENYYGVVGVAPETSLIALRFMGAKGEGLTSDAIRALAYSVRVGAQVVNNSWGTTAFNPMLESVMRDMGRTRHGKGILIINAAGNENSDNDALPVYPSNYRLPHVLSVASINDGGKLSDFSNYGETSVDIAAPGERIYSTYLNNGFKYLSGTSMATPHVAGVGALIYSAFKKQGFDPRASSVKEILVTTGRRNTKLTGVTLTGKEINAGDAALFVQMGGLWLQIDCMDLSVKLGPGQMRPIHIRLFAYEPMKYKVDLVIFVKTEKDEVLKTIRIPVEFEVRRKASDGVPFALESGKSYPVPEEALGEAVGDAHHACDLQLEFSGKHAETGGLAWWQWMLIGLSALTGLVFLLVVGLTFYDKCIKRERQEPDKAAAAPPPPQEPESDLKSKMIDSDVESEEGVEVETGEALQEFESQAPVDRNRVEQRMGQRDSAYLAEDI